MYYCFFYQDFNIKGNAHKQEALPESKEELLSYMGAECPIKPSLLIWFGSRVHAIWILGTPYEIEDDTSYMTADGHDKVHELSCLYSNYIYEEMEKKYRLATEHDMPITCNVIKERGMIARIVVMG